MRRWTGNHFFYLFGSYALLALCLLWGNAFAGEEELPKADEVLAQYLEATGGLEAYDQVKNRKTESTMEMAQMGLKMSFTIIAAKPNKVYTLMESDMMGKTESGCNGEECWENSVMRGPVLKEGKEKETMIRESLLDRWAQWKKIYEKAECVGLEDVDGKSCYKLQLTPVPLEEEKDTGKENGSSPSASAPPPEGSGEEAKKPTHDFAYFDKESHLLIQLDKTQEGPMGAMTIQFYLSDYREVDGLLLPFKNIMKSMGQEMVFTTTKIEQNLDLEEDPFTLPEDIQALVDKREKEKAEAQDSE
jgi:hypothetical protein